MTYADAAIDILKNEDRPMHYREITDFAILNLTTTIFGILKRKNHCRNQKNNLADCGRMISTIKI